MWDWNVPISDGESGLFVIYKGKVQPGIFNVLIICCYGRNTTSVILKAALTWYNLEQTFYGGGDIVVEKLQTGPVVVAEALTSSIRQ